MQLNFNYILQQMPTWSDEQVFISLEKWRRKMKSRFMLKAFFTSFNFSKKLLNIHWNIFIKSEKKVKLFFKRNIWKVRQSCRSLSGNSQERKWAGCDRSEALSRRRRRRRRQRTLWPSEQQCNQHFFLSPLHPLLSLVSKIFGLIFKMMVVANSQCSIERQLWVSRIRAPMRTGPDPIKKFQCKMTLCWNLTYQISHVTILATLIGQYSSVDSNFVLEFL